MGDAGAWMPLYIGDYLADTMHLSGAEHGAYLLLIMHYWRNGPLPDDDRALATIARTERKEWANMARTIREFFRPDGGRLRHKRIDHELGTASSHVEQRRAAGRASAEARKRQRETNEPHNEKPTLVGTAVGNPLAVSLARNVRPSPSPSPSPSPEGENLSPPVPVAARGAGRKSANGAGPIRWGDARIVPSGGEGPDRDRPVVNGTYVDWLAEQLIEATGISTLTFNDKTMIQWLADGYEPDGIIPIVRQVMDRCERSPGSLAYFDKAVRREEPTWRPLANVVAL